MASTTPAIPPLTAAQGIELQILSRGAAPAPDTAEAVQGPLDAAKGDEATEPQPAELDAADGSSLPDQQPDDSLPAWPFACLILQHASSSWTERTWEFSGYLFLTALFPASFIPAALLGLLTTGAGLFFSGWVGGLVDDRRRLAFVRSAIASQKLSVATAYALFTVLFIPLRDATKSAWKAPGVILTPAEEAARSLRWAVILVLVLIIASGSSAGLASGGLNTSIQRDWAMTLAGDSTRKLTTLNTWLRRTDLLCTLIAPLIVSALTTATSYEFTICFYLGFTVLSTGFEYVWIGIVYEAFPILAEDEAGRQGRVVEARMRKKAAGRRSVPQLVAAGKENMLQMRRDWADFASQPIFLSSVALSLIYLQTLSFDGVMIAYLKSQRDFSDAFIAGMRGLSVVMGLVGTAVMPFMERRMGLVRGGAWSLWAEIVCLIPVVITLFVGLPQKNPAGQGDAWNVGIFFAFISLSRIGLWSFDLFQLQLLQEALKDHPRRNRLTALQLALQAFFDLGKFSMVLGWSSPADFKWTGVVSFGACLLAGGVYSVYIQRMRGHIFHWQRNVEDDSTDRASGGTVMPHWSWKAPAKRREWGEGVTRRRVETLTSESAVGVARVQSTS